jgi:rhodanese-related sulfurtransferase
MHKHKKLHIVKPPRTKRGENGIRAAARASLIFGLRSTVYYHNKYVTCDELEKFINEDRKILLIDARKPSEYKHSHLIHAVNVHALHKIPRIIRKKVPKNYPIIVYCCIGLRSGWLTQRLIKHCGFTNVTTLRGGFYKWVNEGRGHVYGKGGLVKTVEPQHFIAKMLLNSALVGDIEESDAEETGENEQIEASNIRLSQDDKQLKDTGIITHDGESLDDLISDPVIDIIKPPSVS